MLLFNVLVSELSHLLALPLATQTCFFPLRHKEPICGRSEPEQQNS